MKLFPCKGSEDNVVRLLEPYTYSVAGYSKPLDKDQALLWIDQQLLEFHRGDYPDQLLKLKAYIEGSKDYPYDIWLEDIKSRLSPTGIKVIPFALEHIEGQADRPKLKGAIAIKDSSIDLYIEGRPFSNVSLENTGLPRLLTWVGNDEDCQIINL
jgi:hypothetical protein